MERIAGNTNAEPLSISLPVVPVIPAQVAPGEVIRAGHENQVTQALADLWTDVQAVGLGAVPSTRKVIAGTGLTGGGDLTADRTFTAVPATVAALGSVKVGAGIAVAGDGTITVNSAAIAGGIQTPWLQDVSGGGHSLSTVQNITATGQIICTSFAASGSANALSYAVGSYSFASLASAGKIAVTCDTINTTGRVGIGIVSPRSALSVKVATNPTTVSTANQITVCENSENAAYSLALGYLQDTDGYFKGVIQVTEGASLNQLLLNPSGGKVGIGTTILGASLDIARVAGVSALKAHSVELQSIVVNNSYLSENTYYNGSAFVYRAAGFATTLRMLNGGFDFFTAPSGSAGGAFNFPAPALTILNNGNVGIGAAAPAFPLDIIGVWPQIRIANAVSGAAQIRFIAPTAGTSATIQFFRDDVPSSAVAIGLGTPAGTIGNDLVISAYNAGWTERVRITNAGNVGIGTTAPRSALTVISGNPNTVATATQITVGEASNNPGYVFTLGFFIDSADSTWKGAIQSKNSGAGSALALNPAGGNVGIGLTTPVAKLHIIGSPALPINTANLAGSVLLDDTSTAVGAGGMLAFSAATTVWRFAAIKGYVTNATGNTQGDIVFYVRPNQNDATLSEGVRITQSAVLIVQNGLSIQNLPTGSPGAGSKLLWYDTATGIVHYAA